MNTVELAELRIRREACEGEGKLPVASVGADGSVAPATKRADPYAVGALLNSVEQVLTRFVVLPSKEALTAVQLFALHTWAIDAAYATPYLAIVSAEKQSGKTKLLEVLELLVRHPWLTASASESALFRTIEADCPCLLLDEVDAIFGSNTDQRSLCVRC